MASKKMKRLGKAAALLAAGYAASKMGSDNTMVRTDRSEGKSLQISQLLNQQVL
jgi:hypothetical protein